MRGPDRLLPEPAAEEHVCPAKNSPKPVCLPSLPWPPLPCENPSRPWSPRRSEDPAEPGVFAAPSPASPWRYSPRPSGICSSPEGRAPSSGPRRPSAAPACVGCPRPTFAVSLLCAGCCSNGAAQALRSRHLHLVPTPSFAQWRLECWQSCVL